MFQLVKLFGLYLEHVLENLWRKEIQDDITDDKLDEIKYHYIYYPFLKSFKNFKKDIKKCGCLDDTNIKIDTNKLSNKLCYGKFSRIRPRSYFHTFCRK